MNCSICGKPIEKWDSITWEYLDIDGDKQDESNMAVYHQECKPAEVEA